MREGRREDKMREEPQEYTLAQLVDHPGLGLLLTRDGIEPRCIELALDGPSRHRRETDGIDLAVNSEG